MAPRKTKKKGRKVLGAGRQREMQEDEPAAAPPAPSLQDSVEAVQPLEESVHTPVPDLHNDEILPSIESAAVTAPAPAVDPEKAEIITANPEPTKTASPTPPPPRTSSVGLGLAVSYFREKSIDPVELRKATETKIQAYKSPFGPPAPAVTAPQNLVQSQTPRSHLPALAPAPVLAQPYPPHVAPPTSGPYAQAFGQPNNYQYPAPFAYNSPTPYPQSPFGFPPAQFAPPGPVIQSPYGYPQIPHMNGNGNFAPQYGPHGYGGNVSTPSHLQHASPVPPAGGVIGGFPSVLPNDRPLMRATPSPFVSVIDGTPVTAESLGGDAVKDKMSASVIAATTSSASPAPPSDSSLPRGTDVDQPIISSPSSKNEAPGKFLEPVAASETVEASAVATKDGAEAQTANIPVQSAEVLPDVPVEEEPATAQTIEPPPKAKRPRGRPPKKGGKGRNAKKNQSAMSAEEQSTIPLSIGEEVVETLEPNAQSPKEALPSYGEAFTPMADAYVPMPAQSSPSIEQPEIIVPPHGSVFKALGDVPKQIGEPSVQQEGSNSVLPSTEGISTNISQHQTEASEPDAKPKRQSHKRKRVGESTEDVTPQPTAPTRTTRGSSKRTTPAAATADSTIQSVAPFRTTRASSKLKSPDTAAEMNIVEPPAPEPRKKRKYTRRQPAGTVVEGNANVPSTAAATQPEQGQNPAIEQLNPMVINPPLQASAPIFGAEGPAPGPSLDESAPKKNSPGDLSASAHAPFDGHDKIRAPATVFGELPGGGVFSAEHASQSSVPLEETPLPLPLDDHDQAHDQATIVEGAIAKQVKAVEHALQAGAPQQKTPLPLPLDGRDDVQPTAIVAVEQIIGTNIVEKALVAPRAMSDEQDVPVLGDAEEFVSQLPEASTVAESMATNSKRKRISNSADVNLEEPLAKRSALPGDQPEIEGSIQPPKPAKRAYNKRKKSPIASNTQVVSQAGPSGPSGPPFSLSCSLKGELGTLTLSGNRHIVEFYALTQLSTEAPRYSLLIADLIKRPITSARKSNPMCIRLKGKHDPRASDFAFAVTQSDEGYAEMHEMRAKIVAATVQTAFQGPTPGDHETNEKPYVCEKCGLRFRNKNGREYHLEKSQTVCNPNHDPAKVAAKSKGGRKKGAAPKAKKVDLDFDSEADDDDEPEPDMEVDPDELDLRIDVVPRRSRAAKTRAAVTPDQAELSQRGTSGDVDVDASSSEDSIFEWVRNTATKSSTRGRRNVGRETSEIVEPRPRHRASSDSRVSKPVPQKTASAKRYKNLKGEAPFFAAVLQELANQQKEKEAVASEEPVPERELDSEACEKIFLELCAASQGIFPGDKSMWFALVAIWLKDYKTSKMKPESKRCSMILDDMVEFGKINKIDFTFKDRKSRQVTRSIYALLDFNGDNEPLDSMKAAIKEAHPGFYVPEGFCPPQHVLTELEKLVTRPAPAASAEPQQTSEEPESPEYLDLDLDDEDEFQMDDTPSVDDEEFLQGPDGVLDSIEDDIFDEEDTTRASKNAKIAASIRKWHADRKAAGLSYPSKRKSTGKPAVSGPPVRRGLTKEEKEKIYLEEASSPAWGAAAPAFLPNSETGAWDSKPVRVKAPPTAISSKPRGVGFGFAEPITYLQSENGAWNQRAYGHGVKPIYARPSKRVEGNPAQAAYLARIESGFRPVLYPTKNRVHGPVPFSKNRVVQEDKPQQPRTRRKRVSRLPIEETQDFDPSDPSFTPGVERDSGSEFEATKRLDTFNSLVPAPMARSKRHVRARATKTPTPAPDFDEVEILNYIEPKKLPAGSTSNPGLTTLPSAFRAVSFDRLAENAVTAKKVIFSLPEPVADDSDFQDGSWVSNKKGPRKRTYNKIRFDEETSFTMETLPYEQLDDYSEDEEPQERPAKRARFSVSPPVQPEPIRKVKKPRVKKLQPTRALTALPTDFDGLTEDPIALAKYLKVEMVNPTVGDQVRKRLRVGNRMSRSEEKRFIVTVIVIRTITGGLDQYIDWVLVSTLFPDFSMNYLNKFWTQVSKKKTDLIDEMVADFQDAFLVAYRDGKVKSINYDNLLKYDWARLVRWTMKNVNTSLTKKAVKLPSNREDLMEEYIYNEIDNENGEAQRLFFALTCPIYRRLDAVAAKQLTIPIKRIKAPGDEDIDELTKAKSFARASALTPIETWNWSIAKDKLTQLGGSLLESAIEALKEQKIIIKRNKAKSTTGRVYEASDAFAAPLRKPIKPEIYLQAYNYKEILDGEFSSGKESVRVDYFGDEGSYMCVTSLMAAGRLKVTGLNIPVVPMGLGDDAHPYDTKRIPKSKVRWDMNMSPTDSYMYNYDNEILQSITEMEPPSSRSGAVPAWNGIGDIIIPDLWKRILCAVTSTIALRTGISKRALRMVFKPTLEDWELSLFMKWGEEVGLFERLDEDESVDGWFVGEHFWLCLGRMVEYLEELEGEQKEEARSRQEELERERGRGRRGAVDDDEEEEEEEEDDYGDGDEYDE